MAGPYNCDICQQNQAAVILGMIETGEQQFLCPGCAGRVGLDLAKALLEPEEIAQQLGPMFVGAGPAEPKAPKRARRGAEKPQEAAEPVPGPEAAQGVEEEQAAAQDG